MTTGLTNGLFSVRVSQSAVGPTDALHEPLHGHSGVFQDAGAYYPTNILDLTEHALTDAQVLDIDLYDLGTLDIGAGAGRDNLGLLWTQSKVHSLFIRNNVSSTGNLVVDQAALGATAWSGALGSNAALTIQPGACIALDLGLLGADITDTTSHMLRLRADSGDLTLDLNATTS